jgi:hypothetical protein
MSAFGGTWTNYGGGQKAPIGALEDTTLSEKLKNYKKLVAKRYRVVFPENISRFLPEGNLWISTKVDGELWFLVKRNGEVALCAYNGRMLRGIPVVEEAEKALANVGDIIIPGELCAAPPDGSSRPRVGHVALCLGDDKLSKNLAFRAFDLMEQEGEDWFYKSYDERFTRLKTLLDGGKRCAVVTTVEGEKDVASDYFSEWVSSGKHEGLVVRSEQGITYKIKPFTTIDAVILAFGEREENGRPEVRELTVGLLRDDGTWHILGSVGTGFSETDRSTWHKRLSDIEQPSSFRLANREGTLCRFVKPEIVLEIKVSDIVDTDSRDMPVRRMTLNYDAQDGWSSVGTLPLVSLIHPTIVRERDDKTIDSANVGLDQIYQYVPFEGRELKATPSDLSRSEILRRGVYQKETKGSLAVRKYVAFATNKADDDPNYPPYVVFFTDFSAGRKDPLKTELRVTSEREMVDAYITQWIAENIKKGWDEVVP